MEASSTYNNEENEDYTLKHAARFNRGQTCSSKIHGDNHTNGGTTQAKAARRANMGGSERIIGAHGKRKGRRRETRMEIACVAVMQEGQRGERELGTA